MHSKSDNLGYLKDQKRKFFRGLCRSKCPPPPPMINVVHRTFRVKNFNSDGNRKFLAKIRLHNIHNFLFKKYMS